MTRPGSGPERAGGPRRPDIPQRLQETASRIGLTELSRGEVISRHTDMVSRLTTGLQRTGSPQLVEGGMAADGGFAALRTGIPLATEAWSQVPDGTVSYVASVGGTHSKFLEAQKASPTEISLTPLAERTYGNEDKPMTFRKFVDNIVAPVAEAHKGSGRQGDVSLGISLAFAHENSPSPDGVDATLLPLDQQGKLPKGWRITDWAELPEEERGFIGAIKESFGRHDIDPSGVNVVILNDTPGTALDSGAARKAVEDGLQVHRVGAVGGTGTNFAAEVDTSEGLINLEFGRYPIVDADGTADPVTERVLNNLWAEELTQNPDAKRGKAEIETETGGKYMAERLRAGIELLGEQGIMPRAQEIADWVKDHREDETLISDLATGSESINSTVQFLAEGVLNRAGQNFGLSSAAVAESLQGDRTGQDPAALLVEGSFVNKGAGVKAQAEATATSLGQPMRIYEADSIKGVAALAMSWRHLPTAA